MVKLSNWDAMNDSRGTVVKAARMIEVNNRNALNDSRGTVVKAARMMEVDDRDALNDSRGTVVMAARMMEVNDRDAIFVNVDVDSRVNDEDVGRERRGCEPRTRRSGHAHHFSRILFKLRVEDLVT